MVNFHMCADGQRKEKERRGAYVCSGKQHQIRKKKFSRQVKWAAQLGHSGNRVESFDPPIIELKQQREKEREREREREGGREKERGKKRKREREKKRCT